MLEGKEDVAEVKKWYMGEQKWNKGVKEWYKGAKDWYKGHIGVIAEMTEVTEVLGNMTVEKFLKSHNE